MEKGMEKENYIIIMVKYNMKVNLYMAKQIEKEKYFMRMENYAMKENY